MKTGYIIGIYTFLGNVRRSSWLLESSVFHFLNSVYFIPHPRISERKTICLSLKTYFWSGKHVRKRVLLVYERHVFSPGVLRPGCGFNWRAARDCVDFRFIRQYKKIFTVYWSLNLQCFTSLLLSVLFLIPRISEGKKDMLISEKGRCTLIFGEEISENVSGCS